MPEKVTLPKVKVFSCIHQKYCEELESENHEGDFIYGECIVIVV